MQLNCILIVIDIKDIVIFEIDNYNIVIILKIIDRR